MKLTQLDAAFVRLTKPGSFEFVDSLENAQGVWFLCPKCFQTNGGPIGTHMVLCWFLGRNVPDSEPPAPGRWRAVGTGLDDLTLQNRSSSILLTGPGCQWHGFIRNGEATV